MISIKKIITGALILNLFCYPLFSQDTILVNIYNNPAYQLNGWNNWKPFNQCGINIPSPKYNGIQFIMNCQTGLGENGASWNAVENFPKEVAREYSYSTSNRTITINGLDDGVIYDIDILCSSNRTNDKSIFSINNIADTVANNPGGISRFTDLRSLNGTIIISITNTGKYNYWNGLILTKRDANRLPILELKDTTLYYGEQFNYLTFIGYDLDGDTVMYKMTKIADTDSVYYVKGWPEKGPYVKMRMWNRKSTYEVIADDGRGGVTHGRFTITWAFDPKQLINVLPLGAAGLLYVYADGSMEIKKPE